MTRGFGNVDHLAAPISIGGDDPMDPSSAWGVVVAPTDEEVGSDDELLLAGDDEWPGGWGAARLGIP